MGRFVIVFSLLFWALFAAACGTTNNERRNSLLTETVIEPGADDYADMDNGTRIDFPAGTFTKNTIILMSDTLFGSEFDAALFPEGALTVLGSIVLNSPVDVIFRRNIQFTWLLKDDVEPGTTWRVFRFDDFYTEPENAWVEIQGVVALVSPDGEYAISVMPSSGITGYSGSFAIFKELPATASLNLPPEFGEAGLTFEPASPAAGETVTFACPVTDADGHTLSFTWEDGSETEGSFSNQYYADGVVTIDWTAGAAGEYTITLYADDGSGARVSISVTLTVA